MLEKVRIHIPKNCRSSKSAVRKFKRWSGHKNIRLLPHKKPDELFFFFSNDEALAIISTHCKKIGGTKKPIYHHKWAKQFTEDPLHPDRFWVKNFWVKNGKKKIRCAVLCNLLPLPEEKKKKSKNLTKKLKYRR